MCILCTALEIGVRYTALVSFVNGEINDLSNLNSHISGGCTNYRPNFDRKLSLGRVDVGRTAFEGSLQILCKFTPWKLSFLLSKFSTNHRWIFLSGIVHTLTSCKNDFALSSVDSRDGGAPFDFLHRNNYCIDKNSVGDLSSLFSSTSNLRSRLISLEVILKHCKELPAKTFEHFCCMKTYG